MVNEVFGEMSFDVGWKTKTKIVLWGKTYTVIVNAEAYNKEDCLTEEQQKSYASFKEMKAEKQRTIEMLLSQYFEGQEDDLCDFLKPTSLLIQREGELALLFDDANDEDNGIAVTLSLKEEVVTQDEYL
jgi:hypothetical protein